jgi:adenine-specific DNA-methyltransferase
MNNAPALPPSDMETSYINNTPLSHRKKYGQFFTPYLVAEIMADWVLKNEGASTVLDPAFGLGIFAKALKREKHIVIKGFEIDECIYRQYLDLAGDCNDVAIQLQDYISNDWENKYDGIICNPPYLKFHNYDNKVALQEIETRLGVKLSGSSNLYVLFLLKSLFQLKTDGFLAYIVPSEFLNADYGVRIKEYLLNAKVLRHVVIIDFNENVFGDAITTAAILLCSKDSHDEYVEFSTIKSLDDFDAVRAWIKNYYFPSKTNVFPSHELQPEIKWRKYHQPENAVKYNNLVPFSTFATVKRGLATGSNEFFTFNLPKQNRHSIPDKCLCPCVCKSTDVSKQFFTDESFQELATHNKNIFILNAIIAPDDENIIKYIKLGETDNVHKLFLTSRRSPWFAIEKQVVAPIWVSVFYRKGMKFIRNETNAHNLTTFHCIYPNPLIVDTDLLFAYLMTDVARQIFDDSRREYGNGLKKFEPNDINRALVADLTLIDETTQATILSLLYGYKSDNSKLQNLADINEIFKTIFSK